MKKGTKRLTVFCIVLMCMTFLIYNGRNLISFERIQLNDLFNVDVVGMILLIVLIYFLGIKWANKSKKIKWLITFSILAISFGHFIMPSIPFSSYILLFYFMMFFTYIIKCITNYSFSLSLGIFVILLLIFMYVVALFGLLGFIPWIFVALVISGLFYLYYYYKKKSHSIVDDINHFINVEACLFAIFILLSICYGFERYVHSWDEYNMWALNAKKIIYNDSLKGFLYPPAMALWYYVSHIFSGYSEQNLYIANSIFIFSFLMSIFHFVKDKKLYPLLFMIILATPYLFGGIYGHSNLYADYPSVAIFTFGLIYVYDGLFIAKKDNWLFKVILSLIVVLIALIKPQGFILSFSLTLIYVGCSIINKYHWSKDKIKRNLIDIMRKYIFMLVLPLLAYFSWLFFADTMFSVEQFSSPTVVPPGLDGTFLSTMSLKTLLQFFLHVFKFMDNNIFHILVDISIFNFLILIILGYLYYLKGMSFKKQWYIYIIPFILSFVSFYFLVCLSLIVMMSSLDALNLASFGRYINNYNVGIFIFVIWLFVVVFYENKKIKFKYVFAIALIIFMSVPISKSFSFFADMGSRFSIRDEVTQTKSVFDIVVDNTSEDDRIYVIDQQDKNGNLPMCLSMYYLYPRFINANGTINWKIVTDSNRDEIENWALSVQDLEKLLIENDFDYIFLYSSTDELFDEFEDMLEVDVDQAKDYKLFKIREKEENITLVPVE